VKHVLHYRLSDGEIVRHVSCPEQSATENAKQISAEHAAVAVEDLPTAFSMSTHRVDVASREIVAKTASERAATKTTMAARMLPVTIANELARTDKTQLPDYPVSAAERSAWRAYRQALRDLSKADIAPAQKIERWPAAPDGYRPALLTKG
jgi:hypothetical protein